MKLFLAALGLAFVLEAIPYFLFPEKMRDFFRKIPEIPAATLRAVGFAFLVLGLLLVYAATARGADTPSVRISIQEARGAVEISGRDLTIRELPSFKKVRIDRRGSFHRFSPSGSGIAIDGRQTAAGHLLLSTSGGEIRVGGRRFQGRVEVIRVRPGFLLLVNDMDLERYLVGLINYEISSKWPIEAVKAQAVAARTYAMFQKQKRLKNLYDLESSVLDQVYKGIGSEDERAEAAVRATRGEVITYRGEIIRAVYHSCCGGKTEHSENVWGNAVPYLRSVSDPYCTEATNFFWMYSIGTDRLARKLGGNGLKEITIRGRTAGGRVKNVEFVFDSGRKISKSGTDFRRAMGYDHIKSTNFRVAVEGSYIKFSGSGSGHGVGMCQWGAKGMADKGYTYRQILQHFYRGVKIKRHY